MGATFELWQLGIAVGITALLAGLLGAIWGVRRVLPPVLYGGYQGSKPKSRPKPPRGPAADEPWDDLRTPEQAAGRFAGGR